MASHDDRKSTAISLDTTLPVLELGKSTSMAMTRTGVLQEQLGFWGWDIKSIHGKGTASPIHSLYNELIDTLQIVGGTNWGNLGHDAGYTSYDYGAAIAEDISITREKYSELKLIGNFVKTSPTYLSAVPGELTNTTYTNTPDCPSPRLLGG